MIKPLTLYPDLNKQSDKPLYAQLDEIIQAYIQDNGLKPGDPLPTENDLIKRFDVSRMTVRIALHRLTTNGLVKKVQGKGTFVAEPKIYGQIKGVQSLEKSFAEQGITVTSELLAAFITNPTGFWLTELGLPPGSKAYKIRRLKKIEDRVIGLCMVFFPLEIADRFGMEAAMKTPVAELLNSDPETEVYRVAYKTRLWFLYPKEAKYLGVRADTPALLQILTHYNRRNKPVATGSITFADDKIEFRYEFEKKSSGGLMFRVSESAQLEEQM